MAKEKKKEQRYYNGLAVDSEEEVLTIMILEELMYAGYISKIERAPSFTLSEPVINFYTAQVEMKTKTKEVQKRQVLMQGHIYTPEYRIVFTESGCDNFFHRNAPGSTGEIKKLFIGRTEQTDTGYESVAYIEVKPGFDRNNMTRLFTINRKWIMDKHSIFINLIQPEEFCKKTFTPKAWLTTATGKVRVIHWPVRTLEQYMIENLLK